MTARIAALGFGSVASAMYAYRCLDYHSVPVDRSQFVTIPITPRGQHLNYDMYNQVLSEFVVDGKVKYVELRKSMMREKKKDSLFLKWLHILSKVGPNSTANLFTDKDEALKFYINAYNALTLYGVVYHSFYWKTNHFLISSVMDVKSRLEPKAGWGFFKAPMYCLDEDRTISLDYLEHEIIRKQFKDARVHCALNCASAGCPKLQSHAIEIDELDELCKQFVNEQRNVCVDRENSKIRLSQIFNWYGSDFEMFYEQKKEANREDMFAAQKVLYFVYCYGDSELKENVVYAMENKFDIEWIPYDWTLNKYPTASLSSRL